MVRFGEIDDLDDSPTKWELLTMLLLLLLLLSLVFFFINCHRPYIWIKDLFRGTNNNVWINISKLIMLELKTWLNDYTCVFQADCRGGRGGVGHLDHVWSYDVREVVSSIPDRGNNSRMSFSSDPGDWNGFPSSEHAFPAKFWIYWEHCPRGEALIIGRLRLFSRRL